MFNDFTTLRYETNYFLSIIETSLGSEYKVYAEQALTCIFTCFFFNKKNLELYDNIEIIGIYLDSICKDYKKVYPFVRNDIPSILKMIETINMELYKIK